MKLSHLISYLFFIISFVLVGIIMYKMWNEPKLADHKILIEKIEKQKTDIHQMSSDVVKLACELKNKKTDTIQIIKNKDMVIVETKENKVFITDTIIEYVDRVDTIVQNITQIDTIRIVMDNNFNTTSEKKRFCLKCKL